MKFDFWNRREKTHADMRREDKVERLLNSKKLIAVFAGVVVLIMLVSVVTLVSEKGTRTAETLPAEGGEPVVALSGTAESMKGSFLLAVVGDSKRTVRLLASVTADSDSGSVQISYIPDDRVCSVASFEGTIAEQFENTGKDGLIYGVRACGVNVDRYVIVDEDNLFALLKLFGEQTVDVKEEIKYDYKGVSYIIEKGKQTFSADNLEKYIIYLCDSRDTESDALTELLLNLLKFSFKTEGEETALTRYDRFVNLVNTDISAMDIASYGPLLERFGEAQ